MLLNTRSGFNSRSPCSGRADDNTIVKAGYKLDHPNQDTPCSLFPMCHDTQIYEQQPSSRSVGFFMISRRLCVLRRRSEGLGGSTFRPSLPWFSGPEQFNRLGVCSGLSQQVAFWCSIFPLTGRQKVRLRCPILLVDLSSTPTLDKAMDRLA